MSPRGQSQLLTAKSSLLQKQSQLTRLRELTKLFTTETLFNVYINGAQIKSINDAHSHYSLIKVQSDQSNLKAGLKCYAGNKKICAQI